MFSFILFQQLSRVSENLNLFSSEVIHVAEPIFAWIKAKLDLLISQYRAEVFHLFACLGFSNNIEDTSCFLDLMLLVQRIFLSTDDVLN